MTEIQRYSPVQLKATPRKTELRANWSVVLEYSDEGHGPWLTDLSHKARWDLQDAKIGAQKVCDLGVPETAGYCALAGDVLINRMNATQASVYHLGSATPTLPADPRYTDVSEATLFIALFGPSAFLLAEKLTNLDLMDPAKEAPFLTQGPFCHVPCQIVTLKKSADSSGGFLLTCSRGYGESMIDAILKAGAEFGLRPAGETRFNGWLAGL